MKVLIIFRHKLTDGQWELIADLFSPPRATSTTATAGDLFDKWNADGTLVSVLERLQGQAGIDSQLWCIDGTTVRVHKCATGGGKRRPE